MLCRPSFLLSLGRRDRKRDDALRVPPLVFIERKGSERGKQMDGWCESPVYIQWAGQMESQLTDSAVETAADFRESNRAARLLADDACMAHTRCPAGLLFRSHTTETAESLTIMTSSTVQCSHFILNYKPLVLAWLFPPFLPEKQTVVTVTSVTVDARTRHHTHTQHASLTYTPLRLARFRN